MPYMSAVSEWFKKIFYRIVNWVRKRGALGLAVVSAVTIGILVSGVGVTMAVTGTFPVATVAKTSASPTPSATTSTATKTQPPLATPDAGYGGPATFGPDSFNQEQWAHNFRPGAIVSFYPGGVRVSVQYKCLSNSTQVIVSGAFANPSVWKACETMSGQTLGDTRTYDFVCNLKSDQIIVTLRGTTTDGSWGYLIPAEARPTNCGEYPGAPLPPAQAPAPAAPAPVAPAAPNEPLPPSGVPYVSSSPPPTPVMP